MSSHYHIGKSMLLGCLLLVFLHIDSSAQDKERVRVSLNYYSEMPETSMVNLIARFRGESGFEPATGLEFEFYNVYPGDSLVAAGNGLTDNNGEISLLLPNLENQYRDSTNTYSYRAISLEHPKFSKVEKDVSFKRVRLEASLEESDGFSQVRAVLSDAYSGEPLVSESLKVQVQRLFMPLIIGEEFNFTDDSGSISVPVEPGIPGLHGNLTLEVLLEDSDEYGTVKVSFEAPVATPIVDQSDFDERSMWAPANKAPMFMLVIPNLVILGVWGTIFFLFFNLFKIYKSKN